MALRNVKLTISYDGTNYHGWQIQPGKRTIQAEIVKAVSELLGCRTRVTAASPTLPIPGLNLKLTRPIPSTSRV